MAKLDWPNRVILRPGEDCAPKLGRLLPCPPGRGDASPSITGVECLECFWQHGDCWVRARSRASASPTPHPMSLPPGAWSRRTMVLPQTSWSGPTPASRLSQGHTLAETKPWERNFTWRLKPRHSPSVGQGRCQPRGASNLPGNLPEQHSQVCWRDTALPLPSAFQATGPPNVWKPLPPPTRDHLPLGPGSAQILASVWTKGRAVGNLCPCWDVAVTVTHTLEQCCPLMPLLLRSTTPEFAAKMPPIPGYLQRGLALGPLGARVGLHVLATL